jgi:hypothetical protein
LTSTRDFPSVKVDLLTDREALIVQLHYAEGWSLRRISRGIGVNLYVVQKQLHRALCVLDEAHCEWRISTPEGGQRAATPIGEP